ncbi:MAG: PepSY-like domain-containing protein [Proteiniphilum sp.]|jgi:hypothetical protein|nr:PepSY-like domain-containing protein [Proteiniphilum sp.]
MKRLLFLLLCVAAVHTASKAGDDRPVSFEQLPAESRQMIEKHFPNQSAALVKMECDLMEVSYEVIFTSGSKVEFDRKGFWKEINCKYTEVPAGIVPEQITDYVRKNYPALKITGIEKKSRRRHEVKLQNGLELEFDAHFNLIDIDD